MENLPLIHLVLNDILSLKKSPLVTVLQIFCTPISPFFKPIVFLQAWSPGSLVFFAFIIGIRVLFFDDYCRVVRQYLSHLLSAYAGFLFFVKCLKHSCI